MKPPRTRLGSRVATAVALSLVLAACTVASGSGTPIAAILADDAIILDVAEVPAGAVTFNSENVGLQVHEIEVFAGASAGQVLPVVAGVADTTGLAIIDEVEDIVPGANAELTVALSPGRYLVICNLPGHYAAGMTTELLVVDS